MGGKGKDMRMLKVAVKSRRATESIRKQLGFCVGIQKIAATQRKRRAMAITVKVMTKRAEKRKKTGKDRTESG
jgi:hypothetical protein